MKQSSAETERSALLAWYDARRRDLPWRRDQDSYRVWVSEIMLQQTRVQVVVPYYEAFMERFPAVEDLASAEVDDVLALWSGLGYYRRARQMHVAAREVAARGGFPETSGELEELPGIGPYTAAAIASISFGEVVAVMDGNVERVISRRLASAEDAKRAPVRRQLVAAARELLDPERPGDSNQALMELGATVCVPRSPRCEDCPIAAGCLGRDDPESYPLPRKKRQTEDVRRLVAVVRRGERLLVHRRGDDDPLMAGLWELPTVDLGAGAAPSAGAQSGAQRLADTYGGRWRIGPSLAVVRHGITHRAITLEVHDAEVELGDAVAEGPEAAWLTPDEIAERATSSMVGKILAAIAPATQGDAD